MDEKGDSLPLSDLCVKNIEADRAAALLQNRRLIFFPSNPTETAVSEIHDAK
jgi:hypothetical protein